MFDHLSTTARFSISEVSKLTGLHFSALRAWEHRYNVIHPVRVAHNVRRYSECDIAALRWLAAKREAGIKIATACLLLSQRRARQVTHTSSNVITGSTPDVPPAPLPAAVTITHQAHTNDGDNIEASGLCVQHALMCMDEVQTRRLLLLALNQHSLEEVCTLLIRPILNRIQRIRKDHMIATSITTYAAAYLKGWLYAQLDMQKIWDGPLVLVGCVQGEYDEVDALIVTLLLRHRTRNARYVGPDVCGYGLLQTVWRCKPRVVALCATAQTNAHVLECLLPIARAYPNTQFIVGGAAFEQIACKSPSPVPENLAVFACGMPQGLTAIERSADSRLQADNQRQRLGKANDTRKYSG